MLGFIPDFISYIFIALFLGSSIAPELEPNAFRHPLLFRVWVGFIAGTLLGYTMHGDAKIYLSTIAIGICIALLAPFWVKVLDYT